MKGNGRYVMKYITRNIDGRPNQRVGIVVATVDEKGAIKYGWSLAKVRASLKSLKSAIVTGDIASTGVDVFDARVGLDMALERLDARPDSKKPLKMPETVRSMLRDRNIEVKLSKVRKADGTLPKNVAEIAGTNRGIRLVRGLESRAKNYFRV